MNDAVNKYFMGIFYWLFHSYCGRVGLIENSDVRTVLYFPPHHPLFETRRHGYSLLFRYDI